jgi:hypothetical protein
MPKPSITPTSRELFISGVLFLIAAAVGLCLLADQSGGWEMLFSRSRLYISPNTSAYLYQLPDLWILGTLFMMTWRQQSKSLVRVPVSWVVMAIGLMWYIYIGSRSRFMIMVVYFLIAKYLNQKIQIATPKLLLAALALLPIMGVIGAYRQYFYGGSLHLSVESISVSETVKNGFNGYAAFDPVTGVSKTPTEFLIVAAVAQHVPDDLSYDYGHMLLEVFTRPIPRSLWPGKIYPDAEAWDRFHRVAGTTQYVNSAGFLGGPATPFTAKWFYMFGWPGMVIGGLYTGWLLRFLEQYTNGCVGAIRTLFTGIFFMTGFAEMNNPFTWIYGTLPTLLLPTLLVLWAAHTIQSPGLRGRRRGRRWIAASTWPLSTLIARDSK